MYLLTVDVYKMQFLDALIPNGPLQQLPFEVKHELKLALLGQVCLWHTGDEVVLVSAGAGQICAAGVDPDTHNCQD